VVVVEEALVGEKAVLVVVDEIEREEEDIHP
jgi:hypothetical protein